jgi:hypothetical protein
MDGVAAEEVPAAVSDDDVEVLMADISSQSLDRNKLNVG